MLALLCQKNSKKCLQSAPDEGSNFRHLHSCSFSHYGGTVSGRNAEFMEFKNGIYKHCLCYEDICNIRDILDIDIPCLQICAFGCKPYHLTFHIFSCYHLVNNSTHCTFYFCYICSEKISSPLHMFKVWDKIKNVVCISNRNMINLLLVVLHKWTCLNCKGTMKTRTPQLQ